MKLATVNKIVLATTVLCTMQVGTAFSEVLPWQTGQSQPGQSQPAPQGVPQGYGAPQSQQHRNAAPVQQAPMEAPQSGDQRTQDDRRLNELATKFYKAKPKDKNAISKLKSALKDVKALHAALLQRTYNAVDIIRDTENLEGRISKQLSQLQAQQKAEAATPTATPTTTK